MKQNNKNFANIVFALSNLSRDRFADELGISSITAKRLLEPQGVMSQANLSRIKAFAIDRKLYDVKTEQFRLSKSHPAAVSVLVVRRAIKLSREQFAQQLGDVSARVVENWEKGITPVPADSFDKVIEIAEKHGIRRE